MENEKKTYNYDEAFSESLRYFGGDELAARVWVSKYALKDSFGNIYELTPDDMHHRIAAEVARIESNYPNPMSEEEVFSYLKDFLHQGHFVQVAFAKRRPGLGVEADDFFLRKV